MCSDSMRRHAPRFSNPTLLTAAKLKGMNSTTASRVASSPRSVSSRNLRATDSSEASGQGWNLGGGQSGWHRQEGWW
jgi:hypothetical protein